MARIGFSAITYRRLRWETLGCRCGAVVNSAGHVNDGPGQPMNATERFAERQKGYLPDRLGLEINLDDPAVVRGRVAVAKHHVAPNGYLHAASVVALVDTACGYGCMEHLPEGGVGFTTIELKANFLGTATEGAVTCEARLVHGGRTTQVWDAEATHAETGKTIALFRCTQMVLYPRES
jgi:1,4-dihydroxy-2-naphthoyl-CoA hydrolase